VERRGTQEKGQEKKEEEGEERLELVFLE